MATHTHRLADLVIAEVSLVDKPANPGARVELFKRAPKEDGMSEPDVIPDAEVGMFQRFLKFLAREKGGENQNPDVPDVDKECEVSNVADDRADVSALEKRLADSEAAREAERAALEKRLADSEAAREAERVDLAKRLADVEAENKRKDRIAKVAVDYRGLPASAQDVADVLLALESCGSDIAQKAETILKAAHAAIVESDLFVEKGKAEPAEDTALAKLNAATERLLSEDKTLTKAQAFAKALEQNPELDAQYLAESGRKDG